ncbi:hypothetical protein TNCV_1904241 [Trichonephila clavipes]|nr:hypothetical protein TNCV_1904241 [Trichonephila clavipes]
MLDWPDFEMVFLIGGHGRRQWAGELMVSAVIEKSSPNSGNLECVSILLSSIWDSDFHGFGNLGLKEGRDFGGGDPMAVQEALAIERSLIGGWQ